ncbi:hypothetical protein HYV88_04980 [Candidatus Woesearchaeota archaeon]|nr:hypothetical protein [Candidatus Woesearchaeota archaeon]
MVETRDIEKLRVIVATDIPLIREYFELDSKRRFEVPPTFPIFLNKAGKTRYDWVLIVTPGRGKLWKPEYSQGHPLSPKDNINYLENRPEVVNAFISGELGHKYPIYSLSYCINCGDNIASASIHMFFDHMKTQIEDSARGNDTITGTLEDYLLEPLDRMFKKGKGR